MDRYIRLTRKTLKSLAGRVSGRLRVSNGEVSVVEAPKSKRPATSMEGLFRDLISMRTVTGDYDEAHVALEYIDEYLSERAMHVKRFEWNGFESLVATTRKTKTPKVMFVLHLDVVPGADELFELREQGDKYYGRGTFDMKFAIPPALQLVDDLQDKLHEYDFGIMINTDEEVGGFDGAAQLIDEGYLPGSVISPDGGDGWKLETFMKGLWLITVTAKGRNAHGSRPWEGDSAITKIIDATQQIRGLFKGTDQKDSTITVSMIGGGTAINQVADEATASFDMRFGSVEDTKELMAGVKKVLKKLDIKITDEVFSEPVVNSLSNPMIASFASSIQKVTGTPPGEVISHAGSDARHFAAKNIPCIIVRPPGGNHHGPGEWISKKGFFQIKDIYQDYIEREAKLDPKQASS